MTNKPLTITVAGTPTDKHWTQAYSFEFETHSVFTVIELKNNTTSDIIDLSSYGNTLAEDIQQKLSILQTPSVDKLKQTLIKLLTDNPLEDIEINIAIATLKQNIITIAISGQLNIILFRDQPKQLISNSPNISGLSGILQQNDSILILTKDLTPLIYSSIKNIITDKQPKDLISQIIHAQKNSSGLAGAICTIRTQKPNITVIQKLKPNKKINIHIPNFIKLKLNTKNQELFIKKDPTQTANKNRKIGLALLSLFILSSVFGMVKHTQITKQKRFDKLASLIDQNVNNARNISNQDPLEAKKILESSEQEIQNYINKYQKDGYIEKAKKLEDDLNKYRQEILKEVTTDPRPFIDLESISDKTLSIKKLKHKGDNIYILSQDSIIILNLKDRSRTEIPISTQNQDIIDISIASKKIFLLTNDGVLSISTKPQNNDKTKQEITKDDTWIKPAFIGTYANNIYILDSDQGEIWKYPVIDNGYGKRRRWFGKGIQLDLSNVVDFDIDGNIWILTSTGKLEQYSRGVPTSFTPSFPTKPQSPKSIYATDSNIYILDTDQQTIISINKETGEYIKQYTSPTLQDAKDIFVYNNEIYIWKNKTILKLTTI